MLTEVQADLTSSIIYHNKITKEQPEKTRKWHIPSALSFQVYDMLCHYNIVRLHGSNCAGLVCGHDQDLFQIETRQVDALKSDL